MTLEICTTMFFGLSPKAGDSYSVYTTICTQATHKESNFKLPSRNLHAVQRQDGKPMRCCSQCSFWVENCKPTNDLSCKVAP